MTKQEIKDAIRALGREYTKVVRALIAEQKPERECLQRACAELGGHDYPEESAAFRASHQGEGGPYCRTCSYDAERDA